MKYILWIGILVMLSSVVVAAGTYDGLCDATYGGACYGACDGSPPDCPDDQASVCATDGHLVLCWCRCGAVSGSCVAYQGVYDSDSCNSDCCAAIGGQCQGDQCNSCAGSTCGDGTCDASCGEYCGNCVADCGVCPGICGDGQKLGTEECDDGNTVSNDGCDSTCHLEPCTVTGADLRPITNNQQGGCNNFICGEGGKLLVDFELYGNCIDTYYDPRYLIINSTYSNSACIIQPVGGSIAGIFKDEDPNYEDLTLDWINPIYKKRNVTWEFTIQSIPAACVGKTIGKVTSRISESLLPGFPGSNSQLNIISHSITLNNCGDGYCNPSIGETTQSCSADCPQVCGDGVCVGTETSYSCFYDCPVPGWHTLNKTGWRWGGDINNVLVATRVGNNFVVSSDFIDIKPDSRYALSGRVYMNSPGCTATIALNGTCLSSDSTYKKCFNDVSISTNTPSANMQDLSNNNIVITTNSNVFDGYFNNVKIVLSVTGTCSNPTIYFDDVSLLDYSYITDNAHYDEQGVINSQSACCPQQWCWNGTTCVNSDLWMNNSNQSPIWNYVFTPEDRWLYDHVNNSYQNNARGYRCTNTTGSASWTVSPIKYNWNFRESGYCNLPTDCFVTNTNFEGGRAGCIHDGEYVDDQYAINQGSHYCNAGTWGSRTEVMANFLVSTSDGNPFILFCDNNSNTYNFANGVALESFNSIGGACTIVVKQGASEQVITAFFTNNIGSVLTAIRTSYNNAYLQDPPEYNSIDIDPLDTIEEWDPATNPSCILLPNINIIKCSIYDTGGAEANHLRMYYNATSRYFILSDRDILSIDPNFWGTIRNFFRNLFRLNPPQPSFRFFNETTNFNNIFVMKNGALSVLAVQEDKYDELTMKSYNYTYINYSDTRISERNRINLNYIQSIYPGDNVSMFESNLQSGAYGTQEIYIRSGKPNILWPYLTSYLRDRTTINYNVPIN